MSYDEITFRDPNPVKRWLQRQRLVTAVNLGRQSLRNPEIICDYGAGNGELCKLLATQYQSSKLVCYEPAPQLLVEAKKNLNDLSNVEFCQDIGTVESESLDAVFCLEVFEHLPPQETAEALQAIYDLVKPEGIIVIGVPVEIGIPALYKGIFRMCRRYGEFDATLKNVVISVVGHPPQKRPTSEIAPGLRFHHEHMGFDFRHLKSIIRSFFTSLKISYSPFAVLGRSFMPEVYFVAMKNSSPFKTKSSTSAACSPVYAK